MPRLVVYHLHTLISFHQLIRELGSVESKGFSLFFSRMSPFQKAFFLRPLHHFRFRKQFGSFEPLVLLQLKASISVSRQRHVVPHLTSTSPHSSFKFRTERNSPRSSVDKVQPSTLFYSLLNYSTHPHPSYVRNLGHDQTNNLARREHFDFNFSLSISTATTSIPL